VAAICSIAAKIGYSGETLRERATPASSCRFGTASGTAVPAADCFEGLQGYGDVAMTTLRLAIDLVERAAEAAEQGEPLDPRQEAKQLLRRHPEAESNLEEIAGTLTEEAAAAGAELRRCERQPLAMTRSLKASF
jgi:hypothetical protein